MASDMKITLPSYEESLIGNTIQDRRPDGQRILDSLTTVRAQHIRSTVNTHIYPLIERRAERGLSRTVLALIPSNVMAVDANAVASGFSQGMQDPWIRVHVNSSAGIANQKDRRKFCDSHGNPRHRF